MDNKELFIIADDEVICGENKFYNFKKASEIINKKGLGRNNLMKLLREKEMLDDYNKPIQKWVDYEFLKRADDYFRTPLISTYGINYVKKHFLH